MPALLRLEPNGKTEAEKNNPGSEKFIFVLEGDIEATVGDEKFSLQKNNTLYFDASLRHSFINAGKQTARALVIITPAA